MIDVLIAAAIAMAHPQSPAPVNTTVTIEEDSRQWDCRATATASAVRVLSSPTDRSRYPVTTATRTAGPAPSTARPRVPRSTPRGSRNRDHPTEPKKPGHDGARCEREIDGRIHPRGSAPQGGPGTRKSVVLYDRNFLFNYALDRLPNAQVLRELYRQTPVRYWSKGV